MCYLYKLSAAALFFPLIRISFAICQPAGSPSSCSPFPPSCRRVDTQFTSIQFLRFHLGKKSFGQTFVSHLAAWRVAAFWPRPKKEKNEMGKKEGKEKQKPRQRQIVAACRPASIRYICLFHACL